MHADLRRLGRLAADGRLGRLAADGGGASWDIAMEDCATGDGGGLKEGGQESLVREYEAASDERRVCVCVCVCVCIVLHCIARREGFRMPDRLTDIHTHIHTHTNTHRCS